MDIKGYLNAPIPRWLALVAIASTAVGGVGSTYYIMRKRYTETLDELVRQEVGNTEKFLSSLSEKKKSPQELVLDLGVDEEPTVETLRETLQTLEYESSDETGDKIEVAHNVFTDAVTLDFDLDEEKKHRSPNKPYILEHDEFYESENQMVTLTWFLGDEVLSDEKDEHVPDIDKVVGEDNLLRFGYGSRDPNILYVRNEKLGVDFEIVKNEGKYTEQILGFIQHEDRERPRKFRTYDD